MTGDPATALRLTAVRIEAEAAEIGEEVLAVNITAVQRTSYPIYFHLCPSTLDFDKQPTAPFFLHAPKKNPIWDVGPAIEL